MDDEFGYLTTTGRATGRPHKIEIWYERSANAVWLLAGGGRTADWVRNLEADPVCHFRFGGDGPLHSATARMMVDPEAREARDAVFAKYQPRRDIDLSSWREYALPVALDLDGQG